MAFMECGSVEAYGNKSIEVKTMIESAKLAGIEITNEFYLTIVDKVYNKEQKTVFDETTTKTKRENI